MSNSIKYINHQKKISREYDSNSSEQIHMFNLKTYISLYIFQSEAGTDTQFFYCRPFLMKFEPVILVVATMSLIICTEHHITKK
jgi:hypothetical protein